MRLSDLMKKKDRATPEPATPEDAQASPRREAPPEAAPGRGREPPPTQAPPTQAPAGKTEKPSPDSGQPQQQRDNRIRLSDLMKKKDRVPSFAEPTAGRQDKPVNSAREDTRPPNPPKTGQMEGERPREPLVGQYPSAGRPDKPPDKPPDPPEKMSPDSGQPQQQRDKIESVPSAASPSKTESTEKGSMYDSLPSGIYRAAEQLKIPIPQSKEFTLRSVRTSLTEILARAVDSTAEKEGLWEATRKIADDLSVAIALDSNFAQMTQRRNHTDRLIYHSMNTAVIAIDLAKHIEKAEPSPREIGAAGLLHDLGIAALGLDLVAPDEEEPVFRKHVEKSVEILEEMKVPDAIKTMVAQHHERLNGRGYPAGISGKEFLVSSQILSLSEGFERIMCGSYQVNQPDDSSQENYVQATLTEFRGAIDPDILKALISLRGFYPNDTMVELTNRSICRVIKQNEGFPLRPVVQTVMDSAGNHPEDARIIDLRITTTLSIIRLLSQNG